MQFVFSYDDIKLWSRNFLGLEITVVPCDIMGGRLVLEPAASGILQLLPTGYLHYEQFFTIEDVHIMGCTLHIFGHNGIDEILNDRLVKYLNYCVVSPFMEIDNYGNILVRLDKINLTRDIQLESIKFGEEGLVVNFMDNPRLFEQLRMVQMFLRARYNSVFIVPEDMPYSGYWFSDGILEYTLCTTEHQAEVRMWTSFNVPNWLGFEGIIGDDFFQRSYPQEDIHFEYGNVTFSISVIIAEPKINAVTIERNCNRLKSEVSCAMTALINYNPKER